MSVEARRQSPRSGNLHLAIVEADRLGKPAMSTEETQQHDGSRKLSDDKLTLAKEEISISKHRVAGERVRVSTTTDEHDELISEKLEHQRIEVERVPIHRIVDAIPSVREEGEVTIFPVVEEVLVIERRLVLKEEVRIRRIVVEEQYSETVTLRELNAEVVRSEAEPASAHKDVLSAEVKASSSKEQKR